MVLKHVQTVLSHCSEIAFVDFNCVRQNTRQHILINKMVHHVFNKFLKFRHGQERLYASCEHKIDHPNQLHSSKFSQFIVSSVPVLL